MAAKTDTAAARVGLAARRTASLPWYLLPHTCSCLLLGHIRKPAHVLILAHAVALVRGSDPPSPFLGLTARYFFAQSLYSDLLPAGAGMKGKYCKTQIAGTHTVHKVIVLFRGLVGALQQQSLGHHYYAQAAGCWQHTSVHHQHCTDVTCVHLGYKEET